MSPTPRAAREEPEGENQQEALHRVFGDLEEEHRAFVELVASLHEEEALERPGGQWSAVDSLIHITSWKENALRVARQQADPGAPDPGPTRGPAGVLHINVDRFNAETLAARRDWSVQQALGWANAVHRDLIETLQQLPEERLLGGRGRHGARMWYWMPGFIHSFGLRRVLGGRLSQQPDTPPPGRFERRIGAGRCRRIAQLALARRFDERPLYAAAVSLFLRLHPGHRGALRSGRKNSRISSARSCGSSRAAK